MPRLLIDGLAYLYDIEQCDSSCRLRNRACWAGVANEEPLWQLTCLKFTTNEIEK